MALESLADDDEKARGIKQTVLKFLMDEVGVENGSEMRCLGSMSLDLCLEGGRISVCV